MRFRQADIPLKGQLLDIQDLHPWNIPANQAVGIQDELARKVLLHNEFSEIETVAGADLALDPKGQIGYGVVVLFSYPKLEPIEAAVSKHRVKFPYIPGLLSFREAPVLLEAFERLDRDPDLIFFDGHGVAHPRRLGIASHMGLLLDKPTIGVAKSRLSGTFKTPGAKEGDASDLVIGGKMAGYAVRTKPGTTPVFVSPGHKIDYQTALRLTMTCVDGFRIPKPTRIADAVAAAAKIGKHKEFLKKIR